MAPGSFPYGSHVRGAELNAVLRGEAVQVLELFLLDLREEVVARLTSPCEIGFRGPYTLQKTCGECVHCAPLAWVDGTGVCGV